MTTKADIINGAYSLMRISGLTVSPSPEDLVLAVDRLESMAAEFEGRNIRTDYNFEENPDAGSLHNLERKYWFGYESNLAVRLLPDFGKQASPWLLAQQQASYSFLASSTAIVKECQYPNRMPVGSRNSLRTQFWRRYFTETAESPNSAKTNIMLVGDIKAYSESFAAYLDSGETISSYTIKADEGLTISGDTNTTPLINYTVEANGLSDSGNVSLLQVKIVVTTSASRIETRIINFSLLDSEIRGT